MAYIDLHFHSIYSDGTYTPEELLNYAKMKELAAVSLTDHDTIKGLERAGKQSEKLGIKFINGVEINSCCYVGNRLVNIPVLGYNFVIEKMNEYMKILKALRDEQNDAIIRALQKIGICIDYDDVEKQFEECSYPSFSVVAQKVHEAGGIDLGMGGENMMIPDSFLANLSPCL